MSAICDCHACLIPKQNTKCTFNTFTTNPPHKMLCTSKLPGKLIYINIKLLYTQHIIHNIIDLFNHYSWSMMHYQWCILHGAYCITFIEVLKLIDLKYATCMCYDGYVLSNYHLCCPFQFHVDLSGLSVCMYVWCMVHNAL